MPGSFWDSPTSSRHIRLKTNGSGQSQLVEIWHARPGNSDGEGSSPVVANGIVFAAFNGAIVALNALNGSQLWSSANYQNSIGPVHWQSPIVVNGWVYCSDRNGNLNGLLANASTELAVAAALTARSAASRAPRRDRYARRRRDNAPRQ